MLWKLFPVHLKMAFLFANRLTWLAAFAHCRVNVMNRGEA
jgi:hypothetical protein